MRVGIIALLQESNTFVSRLTTLQQFEEDLLLEGEAIRQQMEGAKHEVGGFFRGLKEAGIEAVPIFAARAYPSGKIEADTFRELESRLLAALDAAGPLDGILAAPHGATVAEEVPDVDGHWLSRVREQIGESVPLVATIDPHANLSEQMVSATNAILAYRTNPHLDQEETGYRAASLMARTLRDEIRPTQAAAFPPMAINIRCQETGVEPMASLFADAGALCDQEEVLSHSVVLGFPYADVTEMGSSCLVVTDDDPELAGNLANQVGQLMWERRERFEPEFESIGDSLAQIDPRERTLLLDMGDNVGGGSPADSTWLCAVLETRGIGPAFVCLYDPESVARAKVIGIGQSGRFSLGGKTDRLHGEPLEVEAVVVSFHDGKFEEKEARHGGFQKFDQGETAVVRTRGEMTVMLTSQRMPPFSLVQLKSCGVDPESFAVIIAKGVIAPLAAYGPVCDRVIHVNTPGATCADMRQLRYENRRKPLFPFE